MEMSDSPSIFSNKYDDVTEIEICDSCKLPLSEHSISQIVICAREILRSDD